MKEKILSVTLKDCRVDTFRSGGKGGQHQNKTSSGVRITHPPSGAVGESREERSQLQNKKKAFRKMVESSKFQAWIKRQQGTDVLAQADVNRLEMAIGRRNLQTEVRRGGQWYLQ
jgi:protein subunit release factor A